MTGCMISIEGGGGLRGDKEGIVTANSWDKKEFEGGDGGG